jgi:PBP1b-binding outer membrane lipoprotein LpoB
MKNIAVLLFFTLLLTSCGKPVEKTHDETKVSETTTQESNTENIEAVETVNKEASENNNKEDSITEDKNIIALMKTNF